MTRKNSVFGQFSCGVETSPFDDQYLSQIETSQLICRANQLTDFYMRGTLIVKGLEPLNIFVEKLLHSVLQCPKYVSAFLFRSLQ